MLNFTNGKGVLAQGLLSLPSKKSAEIKIQCLKEIPKKNFSLTVAISPLRTPARWEWFIEKATELGVSRIQPLVCERTVKDHYKRDRLMKMMISAMKQSQRTLLPELSGNMLFTEFVESDLQGQLFVAHCEENEKMDLVEEMKPSENVCVLIGPEGDFTTKEIEFALKNGFKPVSLGDFRLRSETAGIVVCQNFNFVNRS